MSAIDLHFTRTGSGVARPLLIAHGLFGSGRNWGRIARALGERGPVLSVDMRNHGGSPWTARHGYPDMAADLARLIEAEGQPCDVLGHSMGGKAAMVLALTRPDLVARLIVGDIAPVAYTHSQAHLVAAMQAVDLTRVTARRDAEAALAEAVPDAGTRAFLLHSLDIAARPPAWRLNLPVLGAEMDRLIGFPDITGRFDGPALFLRGERSAYVGTGSHARIRALFPSAGIGTLPNTGHWLHAEDPEGFVARLRGFLDAGV